MVFTKAWCNCFSTSTQKKSSLLGSCSTPNLTALYFTPQTVWHGICCGQKISEENDQHTLASVVQNLCKPMLWWEQYVIWMIFHCCSVSFFGARFTWVTYFLFFALHSSLIFLFRWAFAILYDKVCFIWLVLTLQVLWLSAFVYLYERMFLLPYKTLRRLMFMLIV